ncbi:gas vesicle protein [Burkholderia sp. Bp9031]|uniref:gas vesicle accessory protein GvpU n=1 Tax=Burkholderia sp. Bp9031 TaxID=2184566 RepID=UPI000F5DBB08|nr:gas vesicle accessory protein GvpU [Burkholderia sp. Bp9031]RQZ14056.1 gas vesicle protein [Burkholderia sp. Bp9031]
MSDQVDEPQLNDEPIDRPPPIDWTLKFLVDLANNHGVEMGVILTIGGSVVTGTLIGGKKYFEELADKVGNAWPGSAEVKEEMRKVFAQPASLYENGGPPSASYIHLKDAKFVQPTAVFPAHGILWRGRLSEVSGFSIGSLTAG